MDSILIHIEKIHNEIHENLKNRDLNKKVTIVINNDEDRFKILQKIQDIKFVPIFTSISRSESIMFSNYTATIYCIESNSALIPLERTITPNIFYVLYNEVYLSKYKSVKKKIICDEAIYIPINRKLYLKNKDVNDCYLLSIQQE